MLWSWDVAMPACALPCLQVRTERACSCWSAPHGGTRRQHRLHGGRHAVRLRGRGRDPRAGARPVRREIAITDFGELPRGRSSSTTWPASPSTAPTPSSPRSWSSGASRPCGGCGTTACGSCPIYGRQAFKVDGKFTFWGGLTLESSGGGPGLVDGADQGRRRALASRSGTAPAATVPAHDERAWYGVKVRQNGDATSSVPSRRRRAACGGFEANTEWRTRTSGRAGTWPRSAAPGSTPATGSGWRSTSAPRRAGNWSGCPRRRLGVQRAASSATSRVGDGFQKHSYPFGIMVNRTAGASSTRAPTSATTPTPSTGSRSWSSPDSSPGRSSTPRSTHLLRDEYRIREVTKVTGPRSRSSPRSMDGRRPRRLPADDRGVQRGGRSGRPVRPERQGRPGHAAGWTSTRRTGPTRSTSRRSRRTP